jgi:hypothetical protein
MPAHFFFMEGELFGIGILTLGGVIWLAAPFLSRSFEKGEKPRLLITFGWLVLLFIVVMTVVGYLLK